jgi:Fe2+ transport system protein FeoA
VKAGYWFQVNLKESARQRFLAMGLVKGETISVERVAPLGRIQLILL